MEGKDSTETKWKKQTNEMLKMYPGGKAMTGGGTEIHQRSISEEVKWAVLPGGDPRVFIVLNPEFNRVRSKFRGWRMISLGFLQWCVPLNVYKYRGGWEPHPCGSEGRKHGKKSPSTGCAQESLLSVSAAGKCLQTSFEGWIHLISSLTGSSVASLTADRWATGSCECDRIYH